MTPRRWRSQRWQPNGRTTGTLRTRSRWAFPISKGQQLPSGAIGTTAETTAQALVALSTLGIDAATDAQFSKDGKNVLDGLMQYYLDGGGFYHAASASGYNQMASEQAYYALAAYARLASRQCARAL